MASWQFSEILGSRKCLFVWFQWWVACYTRCVGLFNFLYVSNNFPPSEYSCDSNDWWYWLFIWGRGVSKWLL